METKNVIPFLLTFVTWIKTVAGAQLCFVGSYYQTCDNGCCGTSPNEYCCTDSTGLVIGLVVAGIIVVVVIVVVVCIYLQWKSNQVVRIVESAHSTRTANITILHMSSENPYQPMQHSAYAQPQMTSMGGHPAASDPFGVPDDPYPVKPQPKVPMAQPAPRLDRGPPAFPTALPPMKPQPAPIPAPAAAAPAPVHADVDNASSTMNTSFGRNGSTLEPPGKRGAAEGKTPRGMIVPPLPSLSTAGSTLGTPEPPTPRFTGMGGGPPKLGFQNRDNPVGLPPIKGPTAPAGGDLGLEDLSDID